MSRIPVIALILTGLSALPAMAERLTVTCSTSTPWQGSGAALCGSMGSTAFRSDGPEVRHFVSLTAPATHCSDVTYMLFRPGNPNAIAFSNRMGPGASQAVEIGGGWPAGANTLQVGAIGHVGGCNQGAIQSWAVDSHVAPVP